MTRYLSLCTILASISVAFFVAPSSARAAKPTAAQALGLKPIQQDVDHDQPTAEQAAKCTIESRSDKETRAAGWLVFDESGLLLRRFMDSNADNKVDQWCYYKRGIEVYRDLDTDFNGKADQYRWMGTAGVRWGLDDDEDGRLDRWKMISPEEVTAEVVAALRQADSGRFERLLLSQAELDALGVGEVRKREMEKMIAAAKRDFPQLAAKQKTVAATSKWLHFGASRPGIVPAGWEGSTKDLVVYDNVAAIIDNQGQHGQVAVGSLVRVGDNWRIFDLPRNLLESNAVAGGFFFQDMPGQRAQVAETGGGINQRTQKLISELEQIDKTIERASNPRELATSHAARADILEQLISAASSADEKDTWIRQFADTVGAAAQSGHFPAGVERLRKFSTSMKDTKYEPYAKFRYLSAEYGHSVQQPDADFTKIQERWTKNLELFVREFPNSEDAPDAMLQLAIGKEFAGEADAAIAFYSRIITAHSQSPMAKKAAGAKRRLESVGKQISLQGRTLSGQNASLASLAGRAVLIHYWATWCEPCKQDLITLKQMQAKYARRGFTLLGVNLDNDADTAMEYVQANPIPWPQLYEPGGLDSRLANEMGILTLPTMILVDQQGKVINRNIHISELDEELGKRLK